VVQRVSKLSEELEEELFEAIVEDMLEALNKIIVVVT
jgi:hypothetical protein